MGLLFVNKSLPHERIRAVAGEIVDFETTNLPIGKNGKMTTLKDAGSGGVTITNPLADPEYDQATFRIAIANNEWQGGYSTYYEETYDPATKTTKTTITKVPAKIYVTRKENVVKLFHEYAHAYFNKNKLSLSRNEKNKLVEDFEKGIRKQVHSKGSVINHE